MRTGKIGNIAVTYPDEVVAMFGRNPIMIEGFTGTSVLMTVTCDNGKVAKDKRAPFEGGCFFDLAYYIQALFDTSGIGIVDYTKQERALSASYDVVLSFMDGTVDMGTFSFAVHGVWAAELLEGDETVRMFTGYPFTIGVYSGGGYTAGGFTLSERGMYSVPVSSAKTIQVSDGTSVLRTISVEESCGEGIYLRWVDRYGIYRYWLFKKGSETTDAESSGQIMRRNTGTDFGFRRTEKKVGQRVEVCAPLVDSDTFRFLLGVVASPVLDMYDNGEWVSVDVAGGDVVQGRETLQDFIVSIVLPDVIVQKL